MDDAVIHWLPSDPLFDLLDGLVAVVDHGQGYSSLNYCEFFLFEVGHAAQEFLHVQQHRELLAGFLLLGIGLYHYLLDYGFWSLDVLFIGVGESGEDHEQSNIHVYD